MAAALDRRSSNSAAGSPVASDSAMVHWPRLDQTRIRALAQAIVCGLLWFGAYNVILNEAERRVDAGTAAMLVNVGPIFIVVHKDKALGWHVNVVAAPNAVVQLQHAAEKIAEELRHTYFLI